MAIRASLNLALNLIELLSQSSQVVRTLMVRFPCYSCGLNLNILILLLLKLLINNHLIDRVLLIIERIRCLLGHLLSLDLRVVLSRKVKVYIRSLAAVCCHCLEELLRQDYFAIALLVFGSSSSLRMTKTDVAV